ncbi:ChbG/HpnK family deacetylase [candidate division KSB1 bacterium]|nr:ChbG/HpnK family deacetylase [candidate division KSB1 bacterium]
MKAFMLAVLFFFLVFVPTFAQQADGEIRLLIRGDDMGSSHASNLACIECYQNGIMRSVELMPVCPWFPEAVKMLKENPDLDVGIHLALTSEWSGYKWRPLTCASSIVDEDGFFFPMVWQREDFPPNTSIQKSAWQADEIEKELRAQIELVLKHIPWASHMGGHMGFAGLDEKIAGIEAQLRQEYHLETGNEKIQRFHGWGDAETLVERIDNFCKNIYNLQPGTYIFIDHPALDTPEMQAIGHTGYENVAIDRDWVTRVFTSDKVKKAVEEKGIELIGYKDLRNTDEGFSRD